MIHAVPRNDEREHDLTQTCWCEPRVEWIDPDTGLPYSHPAAPMVVHNSADCREVVEQVTGGPMEDGKVWEVVIN